MELEEMKDLWNEMSKKVEEQQLLNDKIILEMTELKYREKINKLFFWESMATAFNLAAALLIIIFFWKLDTTFLQISGVILIIGFGLSPFLSLRKIQQMKHIDIINNNYQETLIAYAKRKKEFFNIQKLYLILAVPVMIFGLPVYVKMVYNYYLDISLGLWIGYVLFIIVFLFFIGKVIGKTYGGLSNSVEEILREAK